MEESGLVDREKLYAINGRGRRDQFALAETLGVTKIPAQSGGCRLGEKESARRYWPVLRLFSRPMVENFDLADTGRQFWKWEQDKAYWLAMGRDHQSNERLRTLIQIGDYLFTLRDFPARWPSAALSGLLWPEHAMREAAVCLASFRPRPRSGSSVTVLVRHDDKTQNFLLTPARHTVLSIICRGKKPGKNARNGSKRTMDPYLQGRRLSRKFRRSLEAHFTISLRKCSRRTQTGQTNLRPPVMKRRVSGR